MDKVLITGGSGFIGSHLVDKMSLNHKVIAIDNFFQGKKLKTFNKNVKIVKGDIRDKNLINYYSKLLNNFSFSCNHRCGCCC